MAAVVGNDIDSFILEQKAKLASERQSLADLSPRRRGGGGGGGGSGDEGSPRCQCPQCVGKLALQDQMEYRAMWEELHGKKSPRSQTHHRDAGASRQRLESRQPGGRGDGAHAFDWRVERELSEMEYRDLWKEMHGGPQGGEDEKANRKWKRREVFNPQASVNTYEQQKRALQEERKQEMQSFLQQKKEEHEDQSQRRRWKEDREGGKAIPDSDDLAEAARRKMAEDRKREYLAMQEKSEKKGERRRWEVPETALAEKPLQLGEYEQVQQQFQRERQQDYKKMLQSQKPGNRTWKEPTEERLLPVGQNEGKKKQLEVERNQEYNEYLKSKDSGNRTWREPSAEKLLPLGDYEQKRRAVEEARKTEYQEFLRKTADRRNRRLWKEASHEELLLSDEPHVRKREKLKSERQQEYKQYLQEQNTERRNLAHLTDEYKANVTFPGKNESDNAKNGGFEWEWKRKIFKRDKDDFVDIKPYSINKERERNEEYNQFLREKDGGRRTSRTPDGQKPEFTASLPGLRNSDSAKKRKEQQRNAEYNLYLQSQRLPAKTGDPGKPPFTPRNVWATPVPSYDELLDKKRQQESRYRRTNDPSYDRPLESERKLAELDKELDWKKARYRNERLSQGVLDDPSWLSPRKQSSDAQYEDLPRRRNTAQEDPSSYYASLPIGEKIDLRVRRPHSGPESAEYQKKRQQDQYRKDLENQIREAAEGKQRDFQRDIPGRSNGVGHGEKAMDLNVDYSGYIDPEVRKATSLVMASSTRRQRQTPARAYNTTLMDSLEKLDQISPRSEVILGRRRLDEFTQGGRVGGGLSLNRGTSRGGGIGVLDTGFETMIDTPRHTSLDPPPGLQYQPASYVTQGGGGGLGLSSVDEAYSFYATRNPLEDVPAGGDGDGRGGGGGGGGRNIANQELSFAGGGGGGGRGGRVRFEEERHSGREMDFPSDEDKKRTEQLKAQAYHDELNRQLTCAPCIVTTRTWWTPLEGPPPMLTPVPVAPPPA
ncbi:uncharacterized protein LOC143280118 [Babylonia areolata]|uniref:uncharacterized protein LOC143280118 n=1 Tax=Babylonia areolata TaxID=304850 RepID=UPI003FD51EE4